MKFVYVVYIKSSEYEGVFAFLTQNEANDNARAWGKYATVHQLQVG